MAMPMSDEERKFMERQVDLAMSGWPEYENPGDEFTEPEGALLEKFPHQHELMQYLLEKGYIEFRGKHRMVSWLFQQAKEFNVIGSWGNIAWCCDPDCDRVIIDMPISLFLDQGKKGEITQHIDCFNRNLQAGYYELKRLKNGGQI